MGGYLLRAGVVHRSLPRPPADSAGLLGGARTAESRRRAAAPVPPGPLALPPRILAAASPRPGRARARPRQPDDRLSGDDRRSDPPRGTAAQLPGRASGQVLLRLAADPARLALARAF